MAEMAEQMRLACMREYQAAFEPFEFAERPDAKTGGWRLVLATSARTQLDERGTRAAYATLLARGGPTIEDLTTGFMAVNVTTILDEVRDTADPAVGRPAVAPPPPPSPLVADNVRSIVSAPGWPR